MTIRFTHSRQIHLHLHLSLNGKTVGVQQMTSHSVSSSFLCSPLHSGPWRTPGLSIPWICLPTSSSVCLVFFPLSLCLARWFWPDLMNGRQVHTTVVCVLRWSWGLRVVRLLAGSWHGLPCWSHGLYVRRVVSYGSTSFPWFVFLLAALLWGSMIHKHTWRLVLQGRASVAIWNWELVS